MIQTSRRQRALARVFLDHLGGNAGDGIEDLAHHGHLQGRPTFEVRRRNGSINAHSRSCNRLHNASLFCHIAGE